MPNAYYWWQGGREGGQKSKKPAYVIHGCSLTNERITTNLMSFWTQFILSLSLIMIGVWTWRLHQKTCQRDGWAARSLLKTLNLLLPTVKTFVSRLNLPSEFQIPRPGILYEIFSILQNSLFQKCKTGLELARVPRVPGTCGIFGQYCLAPSDFGNFTT